MCHSLFSVIYLFLTDVYLCDVSLNFLISEPNICYYVLIFCKVFVSLESEKERG